MSAQVSCHIKLLKLRFIRIRIKIKLIKYVSSEGNSNDGWISERPWRVKMVRQLHEFPSFIIMADRYPFHTVTR